MDTTNTAPDGDGGGAPVGVTEADAAQSQPGQIDWQAKHDEAVAQSRKWEARAKENKTAAEERDALKAELAEVRAEYAEARGQIDAVRQEAQIGEWKQKVAGDLGVPADVLRGSTLDEITAHGEALKAAMASTRRGPYVPSAGDQPGGDPSPEKKFLNALFGGDR